MLARTSWILAGLLLASPAMGEFKPDFGSMMKDLELASKTEDHITVVIWMPREFWRAALQAQSGGAFTHWKAPPLHGARHLRSVDQPAKLRPDRTLRRHRVAFVSVCDVVHISGRCARPTGGRVNLY